MACWGQRQGRPDVVRNVSVTHASCLTLSLVRLGPRRLCERVSNAQSAGDRLPGVRPGHPMLNFQRSILNDATRECNLLCKHNLSISRHSPCALGARRHRGGRCPCVQTQETPEPGGSLVRSTGFHAGRYWERIRAVACRQRSHATDGLPRVRPFERRFLSDPCGK